MSNNRMTNKLTPKQDAFAVAVANGMNQADAYRHAYNAEKMQPGSIYREASLLVADPRVAQRIEGLRAEKQRVVNATEVSDRDRVLRKLRVMMDGAESEAVQLNATIALGKSVALFTDKVESTNGKRSPAEIKAELDRMLMEVEEAGDNVIPFTG